MYHYLSLQMFVKCIDGIFTNNVKSLQRKFSRQKYITWLTYNVLWMLYSYAIEVINHYKKDRYIMSLQKDQ